MLCCSPSPSTHIDSLDSPETLERRGIILIALGRQRDLWLRRDKWWAQGHGPVSDKAGVTALLPPKPPLV